MRRRRVVHCQLHLFHCGEFIPFPERRRRRKEGRLRASPNLLPKNIRVNDSILFPCDTLRCCCVDPSGICIYIYTLRVLLLLASVPRRWMAVRFSLFSTTLSPASIQQRGAVSPTRIYTQHFGTRLDYDSIFFLLLSLLFGFPRGLKDVSLS